MALNHFVVAKKVDYKKTDSAFVVDPLLILMSFFNMPFFFFCEIITKWKILWAEDYNFIFLLQTPLHFAAASTHGGICLEILVSEGANTKAQVCENISLFR